MGFFSNLTRSGKQSNDEYEDDYSENNNPYYGGMDDIDKDTYVKSADVQNDETEPAPAKSGSKPPVSLKLVKPYSPKEATSFVDLVKENSIVVIDISALQKDAAMRFVDYLAGAVYALEGDLKKTNQNTLVMAPKDVDISSMVPPSPSAAEAGKPEEDEED